MLPGTLTARGQEQQKETVQGIENDWTTNEIGRLTKRCDVHAQAYHVDIKHKSQQTKWSFAFLP